MKLKSKAALTRPHDIPSDLSKDFADNNEMAEILSDPALLKRLKAGSKDAREHKGRFVPALENPQTPKRGKPPVPPTEIWE
jgi:hypothetical protein